MRILFFGTSTFALPALARLVASEHHVVAVVTQPDRPAGRGGKLTAPPVKQAAIEHAIPVLQPETCRDPVFIEIARDYAPDLSVVAAYGQFLPDALRLLPPLGSVNLHGSLLPRHRGAAPIQRAIWEGDAETGVCLMWMVRQMDAGDVIDCVTTPILPQDNSGTLGDRLAVLGADLLLRWLPAIADNSAHHHPQDPERVTLAPVIRKEEREINWAQPAVAIWRHIRALAPAPAATTTFRDLPIKLLAATPLDPEAEKYAPTPAGLPGAFVELSARAGAVIQTGQGFLRIDLLQPAGKTPMSGEVFLRGYRVQPGERFTG